MEKEIGGDKGNDEEDEVEQMLNELEKSGSQRNVSEQRWEGKH